MKIKLNHDLKGFKAGAVIEIQCNKNGVPVDIYWRRRLQDSKFDNCIEIQAEKVIKEDANKKRSEK